MRDFNSRTVRSWPERTEPPRRPEFAFFFFKATFAILSSDLIKHVTVLYFFVFLKKKNTFSWLLFRKYPKFPIWHWLRSFRANSFFKMFIFETQREKQRKREIYSKAALSAQKHRALHGKEGDTDSKAELSAWSPTLDLNSWAVRSWPELKLEA